ncbi:hypothetical protein CSC94_02820 [Zhengella mangrovi]|uniref:Uncharacterized protein n=1 Tax=Zhengella mangrovi TaxID=1982044 RepID=A0A2G1QTX1_9HYPH|nr:hypothetical protein [Zhengella mangrovi]PHP68935.1 hypothetical protein CSC94_02820 [Zhengella mangrovi]
MSTRDRSETSSRVTRATASAGWLFAAAVMVVLASGAWLILSDVPGDAHGFSQMETAGSAFVHNP